MQIEYVMFMLCAVQCENGDTAPLRLAAHILTNT